MRACGLDFQNPLVLAAGTAAYGRELAGVMRLERLGGLVTKAVSVEPRKGAPAPRVAEFPGGMINAVGLANPGVEAVRDDHLPWLSANLPDVRKIVNVVGSRVEDFASVVRGLEAALPERGGGVDAFELNVSCPNVKAGGMEFGADPAALREVVSSARRESRRPIFVKLSPTLADLPGAARTAVDAGADALTLVNTLPGLLIDVERRRPALGFGSGGVSGPGLLPVGLLATWKVTRAVKVPVMGVGGVSTANDVLSYLMAGATLVGVGTAALRDPSLPERILADLERWRTAHDVKSLADLIGTLEWPA
jgi:dihydroorotate dehydrogenase (NAD+) catalytic subunit